MSTQLETPAAPGIDAAIDLALLLRDLESIEECKCESEHRETGPEYACTHSVIARKVMTCSPSFNVCRNAMLWGLSVNGICHKCKQNIRDCWSYIPI